MQTYLPADEVHLWRVLLDRSDEEVVRSAETLSHDERQRADRFQRVVHRNRYIIGRSVLRNLISHYVGIPASRVVFEYGAQGKPSLVPPVISFNVSHTGDVAVSAFARQARLGVDVERIVQIPDGELLASRYFCPAEATELAALPASLRTEAFFNCWTRKEAYIKAIGEGLRISLDSFQVTLAPGSAARFVHIGGMPGGDCQWQLHAFRPSQECVGALVIDGRQHWQLRMMPTLSEATRMEDVWTCPRF